MLLTIDNFLIGFDRYYTVLFGVSRAIGICAQVGLPFIASLTSFLIFICRALSQNLYPHASFLIDSANMGPSSWTATGEAKECHDGMARKLL